MIRLGIAIHGVLGEARIEIPFPQQELRVPSITTEPPALPTRT